MLFSLLSFNKDSRHLRNGFWIKWKITIDFKANLVAWCCSAVVWWSWKLSIKIFYDSGTESHSLIYDHSINFHLQTNQIVFPIMLKKQSEVYAKLIFAIRNVSKIQSLKKNTHLQNCICHISCHSRHAKIYKRIRLC